MAGNAAGALEGARTQLHRGVIAYLPVLLNDISGPTMTGALIGTEGLLVLFIPRLVGQRYDSLQTRIGGRMPFLLAGAPLAAGALLMLPLAMWAVASLAVLLSLPFLSRATAVVRAQGR